MSRAIPITEIFYRIAMDIHNVYVNKSELNLEGRSSNFEIHEYDFELSKL